MIGAGSGQKLRLALVGLGAIALKRHLPVLAEDSRFQLVAIADPRAEAVLDGVRRYADLASLLAAEPAIDAVSICTPPQSHCDLALAAIAAGKHVLLEKPTASTLGEVEAIRAAAVGRRVAVLGAWHSHFNNAVERATELLAGRQIADFRLFWEEDVEAFHANQGWVWESGGFGVFDAGVNGLAVLTKIIPGPLVVQSATFYTPPGSANPIAVELAFRPGVTGRSPLASMDWRISEPRRMIAVETVDGQRLELTQSCRHLSVDGQKLVEEDNFEYRRIYRRFAALVDARSVELDDRPLRLVADACLIGTSRPA